MTSTTHCDKSENVVCEFEIVTEELNTDAAIFADFISEDGGDLQADDEHQRSALNELILCCVPGCSTINIEDFSFHTFPGPEPDRQRYRKWKRLLNMGKPKKSDQICSKHFAKDQFKHCQGQISLELKDDALPKAVNMDGKQKSPSAIRLEEFESESDHDVPLTKSQLLIELSQKQTNEELSSPNENMEDTYKSDLLLQQLVDRLKNFAFCQCVTCMFYYKRLANHFDRIHKQDVMEVTEPMESTKVVEEFDYFDAFIEKASDTESDHVEPSTGRDSVEMAEMQESSAERPTIKQPGQLKEYHLSDMSQIEVVNTPNQVFFKVEKTASGMVYNCTVCGLRMAYQKLMGHFKEHKNERKPPIKRYNHRTEFQCVVCEEVFLMRTQAQKCVQTHGPEDWSIDKQSLIQSNEMDTCVANEVEIEHDNELDGRQEVVKTPVEEVPSGEGTSMFSCHACDWVGQDINEHIKMEHGKKFKVMRADEAKVRFVIRCNRCHTENGQKLEFKDLPEAVAHRRTVHGRLVDYASTVKNLSRIIVHSDMTEEVVDHDFFTFADNLLGRGYVCVCNTVFSQQADADRCLAKHLGVKKFRCVAEVPNSTGEGTHICKLLFYTAADLNQHVQKVHCDENKPTGVCDVCGKEMPKNQLKRHVQNHKQKVLNEDYSAPAECQVCHKMFAGQYRLWKHEQIIHKQNKNHSCSVCKTQYAHRSDAELCMAKHSKIKTKICHLCNEKFYTRSEKAKHNWKYHNKNNGSSI